MSDNTMSPRQREDITLASSDSALSLVSKDTTSDKKGVSFGSIQVREYNRIVGDHPDVQVGPPLSLSWEYTSKEPVSVDEYETTRPQRRANLRLSSITRKNLLHEVFEIPEEEIRQAEKEVQRIQKRRLQTNKQGKAGETVEAAVQSVHRKIRRTFSREDIFKGFAAASGSFIPLGVHP